MQRRAIMTVRSPRRWPAGALLFLILLALAAPHAQPTHAAGTQEAHVEAALAWLATKQRADGVIQDTHQTNVVEALAAAGLDPKAWPSPEKSVWTHLTPYGSGITLYNSYLRIVHAASVAGYDARDVHGVDYLALLWQGYDGVQFGSPTTVNDDAWAILALHAASARDERAIENALLQIESGRATDGGWSHQRNGLTSSTEVTGMVLVAKRVATGAPVTDARAKALLDATRAADGGHDGKDSLGVSCQSTLWAVHGYAALGLVARADTLEYLERCRDATTGAFAYKPGGRLDSWATSEMIVFLHGAGWPYRSFGGGAIASEGGIHAGQAMRLTVEGPYTDARWRIGETELRGRMVEHVFTTAGAHHVEVHAWGSDMHARLARTLVIERGPPDLRVADPPARVLRGETVTIDARASLDAAGTIAGLEVDWGDGAWSHSHTLITYHAYATPGARDVRARVQNDVGAWSTWTHFPVEAINRAPVFAPFPALVVDRVSPPTFSAVATDADGDVPLVGWRMSDGRTGTGAVELRFATVGTHVVAFEADDGFGGRAFANLTVTVVNLPPTLVDLRVPPDAVADVPFAVSVIARDPDGPDPLVRWHVGNVTFEDAAGDVVLDEGTHHVLVEAVDRDGAVTSRTTSVRVAAAHTDVLAAGEPTSEATPAPAIENFTARWESGALAVRFEASPPHAERVVRWTSDAGSGVVVGDDFALPLEGATWAEVVVEARVGERVATASSGRLHTHADAPPLAPIRVESSSQRVRVDEPVTFEILGAPSGARFFADFGGALLESAHPRFAHAFSQPGAHEVRFEARHPDGRSSRTSVVVLVQTVTDARTIDLDLSRDVRIVEHVPDDTARVETQVEGALTPLTAPAHPVPTPAALTVAGLLLAALAWRGTRRR